MDKIYMVFSIESNNNLKYWRNCLKLEIVTNDMKKAGEKADEIISQGKYYRTMVRDLNNTTPELVLEY